MRPRRRAAARGAETELTGDGKGRRLSLEGGGVVAETLLSEGERSYSYSIDESPLPIANYLSTIGVRPDGDGCVVEWESTFEPSGASEDEAVAIIEGMYQAGLDAL